MSDSIISRQFDRYRVHVVDRALDVLEAVRDAGRPLRLEEVSRRLGVAKSSAFRLLCTLERRGYVERHDEGGRYRLGLRWLSYRDVGARHAPLTEAAIPHMRRLLDTFKETVNLGVLNDGEVLYLEMLESSHSFRMAAAVGTRSPVHSTALGKAIAAHLPAADIDRLIRTRGLRALTPHTTTSPAAWKRELARTRARGFSEDNGETEAGATCLGATILGPDGDVVGAVSISGPTSRVRPIKRAAARALVNACASISRALGHSSRSVGAARG
jgi:IclR family acetate operon transcriptional repressor